MHHPIKVKPHVLCEGQKDVKKTNIGQRIRGALKNVVLKNANQRMKGETKRRIKKVNADAWWLGGTGPTPFGEFKWHL